MMRHCFARGLFSVLLGCAATAEAAQPAETASQIESSGQPAAPELPSAEASQSPAEQPSDAPVKEWTFTTIGYVWAAGAHGETDVIGPVEPVGLDLSFGDVLGALKFAFMGAATVQHDRFVALGDLTFIHLDANEGIDIRDQNFVDAELDSRTAEITLVGGYRVIDKDPVHLDLMAGGRMNFFKTTLQLEGPNQAAEGSIKKSWFDPLIAARAHVPLGSKWSLTFYGDLGGIITGSDITWQTVANVEYQLNRKMWLGGGWRAFKVHYDDGDFLYDVAQSGPLLTFRTIL